MNKDLLTNFDAFRKWFNRNFKLSLNGKYAGLCRLKNWQLLAYKLYKVLSGRYRKPVSERLVFKMKNERVVLYMY